MYLAINRYNELTFNRAILIQSLSIELLNKFIFIPTCDNLSSSGVSSDSKDQNSKCRLELFSILPLNFLSRFWNANSSKTSKFVLF